MFVSLTRERVGNIWIAHGEFLFLMQRSQLYIKHEVDVARDKGDQRVYRFCVFLLQLRPCYSTLRCSNCFLSWFCNDKEVAIAKEKQRTLLRAMPPYLPRDERERESFRIHDNRLQYVLLVRDEATSQDLIILCLREHPVLANSVKVMFKSKAVNLRYISYLIGDCVFNCCVISLSSVFSVPPSLGIVYSSHCLP